MLLTLALILMLVTLILTDLYINRDLLSPVVLFISHAVLIFLVPSFFKLLSHQPIAYVPIDEDHLPIFEYTNLLLFIINFSFGFCFLLMQRILKNFRPPDIRLVFKDKTHFWIFQCIGFGSFFVLMTLMPYNFWGGGDEAYYHMQGYGVANWASLIFFIFPAFLFLPVREHQKWAYPALICSLILLSLLLNRGTQTVYFLLCTFVVLREKFDIRLRTQVLVILLIPLLMVITKFLIVFIESANSFKETFIWFITYDLGRFDYLASAIYFKLQGVEVDLLTLFRYVPFANYLPVLKELNESFQGLPQTLFLGSRVVNLGGVPFTMVGELSFLIGLPAFLAVYSLWGLLFGVIYRFAKNSHNPYYLGLYALFLFSGKGLGLSLLNAVVPIVIFVVLFCDIKLTKN